MIRIARSFVLSGAVYLLAACGTEGIRFPSSGIIPGGSPITVFAMVHRPEGAGPFPAVVLLHASGGVNETMTNWANFLKDLGYVAAVVDTNGSRGVVRLNSRTAQTRDAYGALDYLATLPYVKKGRIGVMGFSTGGNAIDMFVGLRYESPSGLNFKAAINMYGMCGMMSDAIEKFLIPTVVIAGDQEKSFRLNQCRDLIGKGPTVTVHILKDTYHAFDNLRADGKTDGHGNIMQYSAAATTKAEGITKAFLAEHLGN